MGTLFFPPANEQIQFFSDDSNWGEIWIFHLTLDSEKPTPHPHWGFVAFHYPNQPEKHIFSPENRELGCRSTKVSWDRKVAIEVFYIKQLSMNTACAFALNFKF